MMMRNRMAKELDMLSVDPPPGVSVWPVDDRVDTLRAQIRGPEDSPYASGTFDLEIAVPGRYPIEPPKIRFVTPIFHPNIDNAGRICLDSLKMPPKGGWVPSLNISTLLTTIRLLMAEPNADDGLMPDITKMYRDDIAGFKRQAEIHTKKYAVLASSTAGTVEVASKAKTPSTGRLAAAAAVAGSSQHPPTSKAKASFVDDADVESDASSSDSSSGSSSSSSSSGSDSEDDDEIGVARSAERKRSAETSSVPDGLSDNGAASKKRKCISPDPTRAS